MKLRQIFLIVTLGLLLASCHSNEANYKAAYDKAKAKQREGIGDETYGKIQAEKKRYNAVIDGDSVRIEAMHATVEVDSLTVVYRYSVVVAQFKQRFNAITMRDRLRSEDQLPAYVLFGGKANDQRYYVVAKGFDYPEGAAVFLRDIEKYVKIRILEPVPWILQRL